MRGKHWPTARTKWRDEWREKRRTARTEKKSSTRSYTDLLTQYFGLSERARIQVWLTERYLDKVSDGLKDARVRLLDAAPANARRLFEEQMSKPSLLDKFKKDDTWSVATFILRRWRSK